MSSPCEDSYGSKMTMGGTTQKSGEPKDPNQLPSKDHFPRKKIAAGSCGILIGGRGTHKCILGLTIVGLMVLVSTLRCFMHPVMHLMRLIDDIIYLIRTDDEFYQPAAIDQKQWF